MGLKDAKADKPHVHRALIGFDEHGIPTVIAQPDKVKHTY